MHVCVLNDRVCVCSIHVCKKTYSEMFNSLLKEEFLSLLGSLNLFAHFSAKVINVSVTTAGIIIHIEVLRFELFQ